MLFNDSKNSLLSLIMTIGFLIANWIALLLVAASPIFAQGAEIPAFVATARQVKTLPAWPRSRRHGSDSGWRILNG